MYFALTKKSVFACAIFLFSAIVFFSCQKEISGDFTTPVTAPDLSTKINSSVSGFVTDENDAPVMGASVQFGTSIISTDKYGYFEAKNVQVVKEAAVVTVNKPGYFKGVKTYIATAGKAAFFRIKLIPKTIAGTVNSSSGGTVTLSNGMSVKLLGGSIVNAASNAVYTGTVNVAAYWINPTSNELNKIMPGDLRGLDTDGALKLLQTYGMAAVELTGSTGELLQIANGQKATLTMPVPASLSATAPASIPLWYFDEANGLWKQEGTATKNGSNYVGDVSHFSFWNCDVPANYVQFNCTLKNAEGSPLAFTLVKITVVGTTNSGYGYTDSSGYVAGAIPNNASLLMEVFPAYGCTTPIYSQNFTTTNVNVSLGVITISTSNNIATLNGTLTNCASTPVTNGFIIVKEGNVSTRYSVNNAGAYSFSKTFCSLPQTVTLIGEDVANAQQSTNINYTVNAGTNTVANIQACGVSTQQFINYTINGTSYTFSNPSDSLVQAMYTYQNVDWNIINGATQNQSQWVVFWVDNAGIGVNTNQLFGNFSTSYINDSMTYNPPIFVHITENGPIGQYISGNFSGIMTGRAPTNTQYNITCNFRVRRNQ